MTEHHHHHHHHHNHTQNEPSAPLSSNVDNKSVRFGSNRSASTSSSSSSSSLLAPSPPSSSSPSSSLPSCATVTQSPSSGLFSMGSTLSYSTTSGFVSADQCIHSHFEQRRAEIHAIYDTIDKHGKGYVTLGDLTDAIRLHGLDPVKNKEVKALLQDLVSKHRDRQQQTVQQQQQQQQQQTMQQQSGPAHHRIRTSIGGSSSSSNSRFGVSMDSPQDLEGVRVEFDDFFNLLNQEDGGENIIQRAFTGRLAIPNWSEFCTQIVEIFEEVRENKTGRNADYIPQLSEVDPELYGCSICTVDGQRFSVGDYEHEFTLQSCSKVFAYCIACEENGVQVVHKHIGFEPSGVSFNAFTLDDRSLPHNPMINAGAIVNCSLIKPRECASRRFTHVSDSFSEIAGGAKLGFDNATFLSEKDTADRNFALAYYMKENGVFPRGAVLEDTLDFYFQICSMLISCEKLAVMASTLANAGTCPLTDKKIISAETVKCALQLMYSCGMYDYSGEWASIVGLPAKSGVSGAICVVIPGVMGMSIFSPRLDRRGNSVRGVEFCRRASQRFKWSIFDRMVPEQEDEEMSEVKRQSLAYASASAANLGGDLTTQSTLPMMDTYSSDITCTSASNNGNTSRSNSHLNAEMLSPDTMYGRAVIRSGTKRKRNVEDSPKSNDDYGNMINVGLKRSRNSFSPAETVLSSPAFTKRSANIDHEISPLRPYLQPHFSRDESDTGAD